MPRPMAPETVQLTFRLPRPVALALDEAADLLSRPGSRKSRTDALRAAILRGLEVIRAEAAAR